MLSLLIKEPRARVLPLLQKRTLQHSQNLQYKWPLLTLSDILKFPQPETVPKLKDILWKKKKKFHKRKGKGEESTKISRFFSYLILLALQIPRSYSPRRQLSPRRQPSPGGRTPPKHRWNRSPVRWKRRSSAFLSRSSSLSTLSCVGSLTKKSPKRTFSPLEKLVVKQEGRRQGTTFKRTA